MREILQHFIVTYFSIDRAVDPFRNRLSSRTEIFQQFNASQRRRSPQPSPLTLPIVVNYLHRKSFRSLDDRHPAGISIFASSRKKREAEPDHLSGLPPHSLLLAPFEALIGNCVFTCVFDHN
ncbi:hypothetical protein GWI33_016168 [Rhynchophorus ferrugineus]|uniref:Uncharacterized protein n=1 Tax=Rhynchophorus ferrugineus TaxID=354439 RepID=A0A834HZ78_RHYFE|nr:hypothetical protein GWI33_016168 [Rhynchophorus ferrugineus]